MALKVEVVVDGSASGQDFLGSVCALEPLHLALSSPTGLMRVPRAIIPPLAPFMPAFNAQIPNRGAVGSEIVRHQSIGLSFGA